MNVARALFATSILFPVMTGVLLRGNAVASDSKPNIVFIVADDLGIGDLGCYGNPILNTPVIDSLAHSGVRLTHHYAPSPLCAPSRAGLLTGRFNHRTGAVDVPSNRGLDRIDLSEKTFGDYFRHAGYATALIGKWHNGLYCKDHLPHRRGFDLFVGFPNGGQDYWKWNLLRNDQPIPHDGRYLTDVINDAAINFIGKSVRHSQPFALFLAHHAPHPPLQAPDELVQKYRKRLGDNASENVAIMYAMIESMDRGLGRVFQTLKDRAVWNETIVVFTSDNGAYLGKINGVSTHRFHHGLSGNKGDVGEQGIRVPAIVSWPGHIPATRELTTPVHGCDWLPTLYAATGEPPPQDAKPLDGLNIMSVLKGESDSLTEKRALPFQKNRYYPVGYSDAAIRKGRWKLVWEPVAITMKKENARDNPSYLRGIENPHWEMPLDRELGPAPLVEIRKPKLFDLQSDPGEKNDLAIFNSEIVRELATEYKKWFGSVMKDWRSSRQSILQHDRNYWANRQPPDPRKLFEDYWLWKRAPANVDHNSADPLTVFPGYWTNE